MFFKKRVCPVQLAHSLEMPLRRLIQNPKKILEPHLKEGMTVLDLGCGPGFFTLDMAELVGPRGRIIAADLQEGMLARLKPKLAASDIGRRITLHQTSADSLNLQEDLDFVFAFYVIHEIPDQSALFGELFQLLTPGGRILMVEPPLHVSHKKFGQSIETAKNTGLTPVPGPKIPCSKTILLAKKSV